MPGVPGPEGSPVEDGDVIGRLRKEVSIHRDGKLGMSKTAREEGYDPNAVEPEGEGEAEPQNKVS